MDLKKLNINDMNKLKRYHKNKLITFISLIVIIVFPFSLKSADIVINFCPVTKIQASKNWSATIQIQNNSGVVLDLANNKFKLNWLSIVSLAYPFTNGVQTGTTWDFNISLNWPGTLAVGATSSLNTAGNIYSGVLQFPTSGTFTQNGKVYTVEIKHCSETQNYELYDATFDFNRDCFIYSPTKICLGQGATEIWKGEGIFDAMIPTNRPSWAIGVMVAHRLFTNLVQQDIISPNFWMATAMNESRMTCDPAITPNTTGGHYPINSNANTGVGIYNPTNNCFQVLNLGYSQISNNQPDLFAQTNAYGTAQYSNVVDNGNWETGAIAMAYYHYQDMRYWDQIYCFNVVKTWKDAVDPYAIEKIFYHAYHDGPNAGISLLNDIKSNYAAATAATNMNTVITTGGTWSQIISGGSSQKVGNFTYLLDGNNGTLYPCSKTDYTTQYLGCYNDAIKWSDVINYLDRIKILYPKLQQASIQNSIKAVFNGLNGGANVNFSDLGKVIDEIVLNMGGHDPSKYIATQFAGSKICTQNALGVSLRTNDTICPGASGQLQVWLSGDKNFKFILKYPDGSLHTFTNVSYSPFIVPINQPGPYEVVYYEDNSRIGDLNCLFGKIKVPSKNGNSVNWDKSNVSGNPPCLSGPLVIKNIGPDAVIVTYVKDGGSAQTVNIPAGVASYTVAANPSPGQYIITNMSPNKCATPINDTINVCSFCLKPHAVISGNSSICKGDSAKLTINFSGGAGPYIIKLNDGTTTWKVFNIPGPTYTFNVNKAGTYLVDSVWNAHCDTVGTGTAIITIKTTPTITATSSTICANGTATLTANGATAYTWSSGLSSTTGSVVTGSPSSTTVYTVIGNVGGCNSLPVTSSITVGGALSILVPSVAICSGATATLTASGATSYTWLPTNITGTTFTNSPSINTTYTVIGLYGACSGSTTVNVEVNSIPTLSVTSAIVCEGTPTVITVSGATSYTWSSLGITTNTILVSPTLNPTTYTVAGSVNGCTNTAISTITVIPNPTISVASSSICANGTATLTASGATTYTWSSGLSSTTGSLVTGSPGSTTVYTVTGSLGSCNSSPVTSTITVGTSLSVFVPSVATCSGVTATLTASGAASYTWLPTNVTGITFTDSPSTNTTYTVIGLDGACTGSTTTQIIVNAIPSVSVTNAIVCAGKPTVLMASGATSYTWSSNSTTNTISVSPTLNPTTYTVTGSVNGCTNTAVSTVTFVPNPIITVASTTICTNGTATLTASGATIYNWLGGVSPTTGSVVTVSPFSGTSVYTVTGSDGSCNSAPVTTTVTVLSAISVIVPSVAICAGSTATLMAGGAASYTWLPNNVTGTTFTDSPTASSNSYTVIGINGTCTGSTTTNIIVKAIPSVSVTSAEVCSGTPTILTASGATSYTWSTGVSTNVAVVTPTINSTTYTVIGSVNGCTNIAVSIVSVIATPTVTVKKDTLIVKGTSIPLSVVGSGTSYTWSPSLGLSCTTCSNPIASPMVTTEYCVSTMLGSCPTTSCITVSVEVICYSNADYTTPNAFTPNGDGINDEFCLRGWNDCTTSFYIAIFDRWGEKVFTSEDPGFCWDGTYLGMPLNTSVFIYYIKADILKVGTITKKGNITLIK